MASLSNRWSAQAVALAQRTTSSSWSKWLAKAAWLLGSLLLFWGVAYALVPIVAKSQIEKIASGKLGRAVTLGSVDFKPWSLEVTVNDLKVAQQNGANTQLSIHRVYIDAELESLLRLAPVVNAIAVDAPVVSLTHLGGGRYDIDDVLEKLKNPPDAPPKDNAEPPRFAVYNLTLTGGQISFIDQPLSKTYELTALGVSVPFLSNLPSQRDVQTAPRLAFKLGASSFDSAAAATPFAQSRKTDAVVKLSNFDLGPYLGYLPDSLPYNCCHKPT